MIIEAIELSGKDKKPATLSFNNGLNVVVGASNTGKSYVIQCIKFAFGSSTLPKEIKESKGYESVRLTLKEDSDSIVLERELKKSSKINAFVSKNGVPVEQLILTAKHSEGLNNLSNFFLNKINLANKILLKGKEKLTTNSLSLRILEQIFVIDETRIVGEHSPLGSGGKTNDSTFETSFLRTLLTGLDDKEAKKIKPKIEQKNISKTKVSGLLEMIDELYPFDIEEYQLKSNGIDKEIKEIKKEIDIVQSDLSLSINNSQETLEKKDEVIGKIEKLDESLRENNSLVPRFKLLHSKYESDIDRLQAINESTRLFEEYQEVSCPMCHQTMDTTCNHNIKDVSIIVESTNAEINKIEKSKLELLDTIFDIETEIKSIEIEIAKEKSILKGLEGILKLHDITSEIQNLRTKQDEYQTKKKEVYRLNYAIEEKTRVLQQIASLQKKNEDFNESYSQSGYDSELISLSGEIESVLQRWGFPEYKPTNYCPQNRDLLIGDIPRKDFGKGYRAIGFSAFIVGLMNVLSRKKRHPGFVVLDSPLTTYKEAEGEELTEEDEISEDVIYSFYSDLCDSYKDKQVIVFENREPDPSLVGKMKYQKFSKNRSIGRYGFFPPLD